MSLHDAAATIGIGPLLEISTKSPDSLGVALSAFNLTLDTSEYGAISVECAFQGSKVFEGGGPYTDLYTASSRDARVDPRLRASGGLVAFCYLGVAFPTEPSTAFYDWLYGQALAHRPDAAKRLLSYRGFTDIAFNPQKSWNCQARSAALYSALSQLGLAPHVFRSWSSFRQAIFAGRPVASEPRFVQPVLELW